jgi:septum formation protein
MISLKYDLVLGSQSPRRREILEKAGFKFRIQNIDYNEKILDGAMASEDVPLYLADQKAMHAKGISANEILLTADTLVFRDNTILGKPANKAEALDMLSSLAGREHKVITGVCLKLNDQKLLFQDETRVYFKLFDMKELEYYVDNYPVMDKAGAYGVQDWLGTVGIERIEGNFYNVMGLPMHMVYEKLKVFANE